MISCTGQKKEEDEVFRRGWELAWEDNFDEGLNASEWSKVSKGKLHMNRYASAHEALYPSHEGSLVLRALSNSVANDTMPFLTGGIHRPGIKAGVIARIEVKARVNSAEGATHFLSLLPTDPTQNFSVDIMEHYGVDEFVYQSVSSDYTTKEGMADNPPSSSLVGINPEKFHIYTVEKYPDSLVFFMDDTRTRKYPRILTDMQGQYPFNDQDLELFMGVRLNKDTDPEQLPADLLIDWVRVYVPAKQSE